jgi:hypothetical protein
MRYLNYINENNFVEAIEDKRESIDFLNKECSQFVKELKAGKRLFLRTRHTFSRNENDLLTMKSLHGNREPIDTPKELSKKVDELLKSYFGWKPRSEGYFVWIDNVHSNRIKSNPNITRVIFPINGYKYVYSPEVMDLFDNYSTIYKYKTPDREFTEFLVYFRFELLPTYTNKDALKISVNRNIECMVKAPKIVSASLNLLPEIREEYKL